MPTQTGQPSHNGRNLPYCIFREMSLPFSSGGWLLLGNTMRTMTWRLWIAGFSVLGIGICGTRPAAAESAPSRLRLEPIVVTATKRPELLRNVPMSITVVSGNQLARMHEVNFSDYVQTIPGMIMVASDPAHATLVLRGISTQGTGATIGTYLDESPYGSSSALADGLIMTPNIDTFDMKRIEVLRGPQGTLYGANTLGGLIRFVTNPPNPAKFDNEVQVGLDDAEHGGFGWSTKGMVNIPLTSDMALRIDGYRWKHAGFINDPTRHLTHVNGYGEKGGRASLLWGHPNAITVRLTAYLQDMVLDGTNGIDLTTVPAAGTASGLRISLTPLYGPLAQGRVASEASTVKNRLYNATVNWNLGWGELTSATSYGTYFGSQIQDATALFGTLLRSDLGEHKLTEEMRLASIGAGRISWLVGLFYTHETASLHQDLIPTLSSQSVGFVQLSSTYLELAEFGNVTYHFSKEFDLSVGGRWAHNRQSANEFGLASAAGRSSEGVFTYSVAPHWHPSASTMVYARVAKGFQPGGPNVLPPNPPADVPATFHSDTLTNYELGVKSRQYHGRLSLDADLFYIDWKGIQLQTVVQNFGVNGNGGSAVSKGLEWQAAWIPINRLTVRVGGAYTDARLTSSTDPVLVGAPSGAWLPYIPEWSGSATAEYTYLRRGNLSAFCGADWRYTGPRKSGFNPALGQASLPNDSEFDLNTGVRRGRWTLELYARNITDERAIVEIDQGGSSVTQAAPVGDVTQPRVIGLTLTGKL